MVIPQKARSHISDSLAWLVFALVVFLLPATSASQSHPGQLTIVAGDPGQLRDWDALITRMVDQGELRTRQVREDTLVPGRTHERLAQFHRGVPVFGGELVRQWDGVGTVSMFATLYAGIDLDPAPTLSSREARAIVERLSGGRVGPRRPLRLYVLPLDGGGYALTYHDPGDEGGRPHRLLHRRPHRRSRPILQRPQDPCRRGRGARRSG